VQVVHDPLDTSNTGDSSLVDLVHPVIRDKIEQFRVEVVKALVGTQSGFAERNKSTGGQRILGGTLVSGSLVVVRDIVKDGVGNGSRQRCDFAGSGSTLANEWWELFGGRQAITVHGTYSLAPAVTVVNQPTDWFTNTKAVQPIH
jgi:hypothetical protein